MVTVIRGLGSEDALAAIIAILNCMHNNGIHYDYWSWWIATEGKLVVTDDNGNIVNDDAPNVELLSTNLVVQNAAIEGGLLEQISAALGLPVWLNITQMEASLDGKRLK